MVRTGCTCAEKPDIPLSPLGSGALDLLPPPTLPLVLLLRSPDSRPPGFSSPDGPRPELLPAAAAPDCGLVAAALSAMAPKPGCGAQGGLDALAGNPAAAAPSAALAIALLSAAVPLLKLARLPFELGPCVRVSAGSKCADAAPVSVAAQAVPLQACSCVLGTLPAAMSN